MPVDADDALALLVALADFGDVLEALRYAVVDLDQQVAHLVERAELVHGAHEIALRAVLDAAAGDVDVLVGQALDDVGDAQPELLQALLIDVDIDLVLETAADFHRSDAGRRFETFLEFVVGEPTQLFQFGFADLALAFALRRSEREAHDRVGGRIEAQQDRLLRFERQLQDVELVANVEVRLVHVGAPGELENHVGLPGARHRVDLAQVLDHADRFLDRLRDQVFDLERRRTFVFGADRQRRVTQVGQQVDLESGQRDQAEQDESQRDHADGDASARGSFDDVHPSAPFTGWAATTALGCSLITCTAVPSRTALRPTVMTCVPESMPERTSILSPSL